MRMQKSRLVSIVAVLLLVVTACGDGDGPDTDDPADDTTDDPADDDPADDDQAAAPPTDVSLLDVNPGDLPEGWELPEQMGHVTNYLVHEWYQNLTAAEEAHAEDFGIDFGINDANLDLQASLAGLDDYLAQGRNPIMFTPVDEAASVSAVESASQSVPIICESSPVDGCTTLVSIDDYQGGINVGEWSGQYLLDQGIEAVTVLDIGLPALSTTVARSQGFFDGLTSVIPGTERIEVDGQGLKDEAVRLANDALTANPDINVIFGINDDSALGGLESFRAQGLDESDVLVVGFGCEGDACKDALQEGGPYKVSAGMFPEFQGSMLVRAAIAAYNGVELPEHLVMPSVPVTQDTLGDYYDSDNGDYQIRFDAVAQFFEG